MSECESGTIVPKRDKNGRLLKGYTANPTGIQRKMPDTGVLAAINRAAPPDEIEALITDAIGWCRKHKSVKGTVSLLQLILGYQLGTPIKRTVSARMKVEDILGSVADMDDDKMDDVIDALYESE